MRPRVRTRTMIDLRALAKSRQFARIAPLAVPLVVVRGWLVEAAAGGGGYLEAAYLAGRSIIARKRRCPTGAWQTWQRDVLGVGTRTAAACARIFLAADKYGGAVPRACLYGGLWGSEQALPRDTCWASADIRPDPGVVAHPFPYYCEEMLYDLAADKKLLALLKPVLAYIRDADDQLAAAAHLSMLMQGFALADIGTTDHSVRAEK